jgi:hypothetical protein
VGVVRKAVFIWGWNKTQADATGIGIEGKDKWLMLIQNTKTVNPATAKCVCFEMNSKMVLLSAVVVLLFVGALAGYLFGVDWTPLKTTTAVSITTMFTSTVTAPSTSLDAYEQVSNSFASHMLFLSERNPFAVVSQYEGNATVTWNGKIEIGRAHV